MASSRMPRLKLGGQGVPEPMGVHVRDPGSAGDAADDPADDVPVQRAAVVGDQPLVPADVLQAVCGLGQVEVPRDLADRPTGHAAGTTPRSRT